MKPVVFILALTLKTAGAMASTHSSIENGRIHTLHYPVESTELIIPEAPFRKLFEIAPKNPILKKDIVSFFKWVGFADYRKEIKRPHGVKKDYSIGLATIENYRSSGISVSCASCHASNFFNTTVIGMPNKGIRANELFVIAKNTVPLVSPISFQLSTQATDEETHTYRLARRALKSVAAQSPLVLGLDTSLSHVGRSLAKRRNDAWATKYNFINQPQRAHQLDRHRADSKPGVWWNVKYKTKYLSDGSVVSGHPITTNVLWNEIGRGADLRKLDSWLSNNQEVLDDILNYIHSLKAPQWENYFGKNSINIVKAKQGEKIFQKNCIKCHGQYQKDWNNGVETISLDYPQPTLVKDVGTDSGRYLGMKELSEQLNNLEISKRHGIVTKMQKGYVPPPLLGIWARYPYFHNNSIPNLCALVDPRTRPKVFYVGPAEDINTDYDRNCVGYPTGIQTPKRWKQRNELRYDTAKKGLSNKGHTRVFFDENGKYKFNEVEKFALIEYLKSL